MTPWDAVLIVGAAVVAGALNTVVGGGTLVTFPTLVALGLPPVAATMTDRVGLLAGRVSGVWGYRQKLSGQWPRLRWQLPAAVVGAVLGAMLLLQIPQETFRAVVPFILVFAIVLVAAGPKIKQWATGRTPDDGRRTVARARLAALAAATFLIAVGGGYFAAAEGVLLIGAMGAILPQSLQKLNAAKNLISLTINVVAAATYLITSFDRIAWPVVGLLAVGALLGGWLGARFGRRLSPAALRIVVIVIGCAGLVRLLTL